MIAPCCRGPVGYGGEPNKKTCNNSGVAGNVAANQGNQTTKAAKGSSDMSDWQGLFIPINSIFSASDAKMVPIPWWQW